MLPDGEGHLWLSTNNGLSRFDPQHRRRSRTTTPATACSASEFNFGAHHRSASGELFFGGVNGFNAFHPRRLAVNAHVPPVVLTAFLKLEQAARPPPTCRSGSSHGIDLGYRDDVVTFEFAALDYAAPERNRYAYKLEGFDPDWVDLGSVRRVTYTTWAPGSYRLRVRAANNDGVWNEAGLDLPVRVEAPPWLRWWAYVAYALALGGALCAFVRAQQAQGRARGASTRGGWSRTSRPHPRAGRAQQELEELNQKLAEASLTDSLTGLRNRRFLFEHVSKDARPGAAALHRAEGRATTRAPSTSRS